MAKMDPVTRALIIRTTNGNVVQNNLVGIANTAMRDYMRCAIEFGKTPSARSRIDAGQSARAQAQDPTDRFFDEGEA
jgi:phage terminase small subunit